MQVIGLCRFSYPAIGGFQTMHDTTEARRRHLYSPARLEERFRLFEACALPGLRAQTDDDFQFLILTGNCLPLSAKNRLRELTAGLRQVQIVERDPARHRPVMKEVLNAARKNPDQPCLQFRHDDDDAVSVDFVDLLRRAARDSDGLIQRNKTVAIDFNQGFLARFGTSGIQATRVHRPLLGVGLGMYVRGGCDLTIMNFAHHKIGNFMPVISTPEPSVWVRSLNRFNDSPKTRLGKADLSPLTPDLATEFHQRFKIDQDAVRHIYSEA